MVKVFSSYLIAASYYLIPVATALYVGRFKEVQRDTSQRSIINFCKCLKSSIYTCFANLIREIIGISEILSLKSLSVHQIINDMGTLIDKSIQFQAVLSINFLL